MKKILVAMLALVLVLTLSGMYDQAYAAETGDPCTNCSKCTTGWKKPSWGIGELRCVTCSCEASKHVEAHEHTYSDIDTKAKAPTCQDYGQLGYECTFQGCASVLWVTNEKKPPSSDYHVYPVMDFSGNPQCTKCGQCQTHQAWEEPVIKEAATCTAAAKVTTKCANCTYEKTETQGEPLGHAYTVKGAEVTAATCEAPATFAYGCANGCGTSETRADGNSLGHEYTVKGAEVTAATCDAPAVYAFKCVRCDETENKADGEPLGHDWNAETGVCKREECDIACTHNFQTVTVKATCVATGSETKTCKTCGYKTITELAVDENAHQWDDTQCVCELCDKTNHNVGMGKLETAATCVAPAQYKFTCSKCDKSEVRAIDTAVDATAHGETKEVVKTAATCAKSGVMNIVCTLCNEVVDTEEIAIDATAHGETKEVVRTAATCVEAGVMNIVCTLCNEVVDTKEIAIDATAHGETKEVVATAATCAKTGVMNIVCTLCDKVTSTKTIAVNANAHTGETYTKVTTAPTCGKDGVEGTFCKGCDALLSEKTLPKTADGHSYTAKTTPATCTAPAKTVETCSVCGDVKTTNGTELAAHQYVKTTTPATCDEPAQVTEKCSVCGDTKTYSEGDVDLTKHDYKETDRKPATCAKPEQVTETCTVCYDKKTTEIGEKTDDHTWVVFGFGAGYCTTCGAITTDDDEVFPDGKECIGEHGYDANTGLCVNCGAKQPESDCEHEWTKFSFGGWICNKCMLITINNPTPDHQLPEGDPDCEHEWVQATFSGWVCKKCGAMTINEPGCKHEKTSTLVYDATCVKTGWTKTYCMNIECTKVLEETVLPIDKNAHGEKKTESLAPTCNATGYNKVICTLCNGVVCEEILPIDTNAHNWVNGTCTICGATTDKYLYGNHMTSFGPMMSDVIGGKDWYRVTPIDLSVDGVYTFDLIASNEYVIGYVTFTVAEGTLTVDYFVNPYQTVIKVESLKIYASKADLEAGNAVEATIGEAINIAENFGEDTKVIVSLILEGDYNVNAENVKLMIVDVTAIKEMLALID